MPGRVLLFCWAVVGWTMLSAGLLAVSPVASHENSNESPLPELGWHIIDGLVFSREGEMLRIDLIPEGRLLVVRFVLSPNSSQ